MSNTGGHIKSTRMNILQMLQTKLEPEWVKVNEQNHGTSTVGD